MADNKTYTLESAKELFQGDSWDQEVAKMSLDEMMSLDNAIYGKPISEKVSDESMFVRQEAAKRIEAIAHDPDSFSPDDLNSLEDFVKQFAGNSSNGEFSYATDAARTVMEKIGKQRKDIEEKASANGNEEAPAFELGDESKGEEEAVATQEPVTQESAAQEPVTEESVTQEPVAEEMVFPELSAEERAKMENITAQELEVFMDPLSEQLPEETPEELKRQEERLEKIMEIQEKNPYKPEGSISKLVDGAIEQSATRRLAISQEEISLESLDAARAVDAERVSLEYYDAIFGICQGEKAMDAETPSQHAERLAKISDAVDRKLPKAEVYKSLGITPTDKQEYAASSAVYNTNTAPVRAWAEKLGKAGAEFLDGVRKFDKENPALSIGLGMISSGNPIYMGARMVLSARGLYKDYETFKEKNGGKASLGAMLRDKDTRKSMMANASIFIRSLPVVGQAYSTYGMAKQLKNVCKKNFWTDLKKKTIEAGQSIADVAKNPKDLSKWNTMRKNIQVPIGIVAGIAMAAYGVDRIVDNYTSNEAPDNTPSNPSAQNTSINDQMAADHAKLAEMGVNPELTNNLGPDALRAAVLSREVELNNMGLGEDKVYNGGTLDDVVVTAKAPTHVDTSINEDPKVEENIEPTVVDKAPDDFTIEGMTHDNMAGAGVDQQTALGLEDAMAAGKSNGDFSQAEDIIKGLDGDAKLAAQDYLNSAKGLSATGGEVPDEAFFKESSVPDHAQMYNLASVMEAQLEADGKVDVNTILREQIANGSLTPEQAAQAGGIMTEVYTSHDGDMKATIEDIKNGAMDGALEDYERQQAVQNQEAQQEMAANLREPWVEHEGQVNESPISNKPTTAPVYEGEKEVAVESHINESPISNKPTTAPVYEGEKEVAVESQVNESPISNKPTTAPVYEGEKEVAVESQVEQDVKGVDPKATVYEAKEEEPKVEEPKNDARAQEEAEKAADLRAAQRQAAGMGLKPGSEAYDKMVGEKLANIEAGHKLSEEITANVEAGRGEAQQQAVEAKIKEMGLEGKEAEAFRAHMNKQGMETSEAKVEPAAAPKEEVKQEEPKAKEEEPKAKEEVKEEVKNEPTGHQTEHIPAEELQETPAAAAARIKSEFMNDHNGSSSTKSYTDGSTLTKYTDAHGIAEIRTDPNGNITIKEFIPGGVSKVTEFNADGTKDITETDKFGQKTITQVDEKGEAKTTNPEENGTAKTPEEQKAHQDEMKARSAANLQRYEDVNKEIGKPQRVEFNGKTRYEFMGMHSRNPGLLEFAAQEKIHTFCRTEEQYQQLEHKIANGETLSDKEQALHTSHEKLAGRLGLEKDAEGQWKNHENAATSHKEADFRSDKEEYQDLNRQKEAGTLDKEEAARLKEVEKELKQDHGLGRRDLRELRSSSATTQAPTQQTTVNINNINRGQEK